MPLYEKETGEVKTLITELLVQLMYVNIEISIAYLVRYKNWWTFTFVKLWRSVFRIDYLSLLKPLRFSVVS